MAQSVQPAFRLLNDVLIQFGLMAVSIVILVIIVDVLSVQDVSSVWTNRWARLRNGDVAREVGHSFVAMFVEPPSYRASLGWPVPQSLVLGDPEPLSERLADPPELA